MPTEPNTTVEKEVIDGPEAEYRLLYTVVVAGKTADFARAAMQRFMANAGDRSAFDWVSYLDRRGELESTMRAARMGCYNRLCRSFREIAQARPNLMTATPDELMKFHGVGPKSAKFAIMWVRPLERFAALDTHVLKWLRYLGHDAPRATPSGEKYKALETIFIAEADRRGFNPRLLDAMIWEHASNYSGESDRTSWPSWLQRDPSPPPPEVLAYFQSYAS